MSSLSRNALARIKQIASDASKVYEGRERYIRAVSTILDIEKIYRSEINDETDPDADLDHAHHKAARVLVDLCQDNGGVWVKFAQYLGCRADLLPSAFTNALQQLQHQARPKHFDAIIPRLSEVWGADWGAQFESFDIVPIATASIAQVYKAKLKRGTWVAVKVLIPGIEAAFEKDILVFRALAKLISPVIKEVDVASIADHLIEKTAGELSFDREIEHINQFRGLAHPKQVIIPKVISDLSHDTVMVTEWIDGVALTQLLKRKDPLNRDRLELLLVSMAHQIFRLGVYHADPHPGNLICVAGKAGARDQLAFLDFGVIATLSQSQRQDFLAILIALSSHKALDQLPELFKRAGFGGVEPHVFDEIRAYIAQRDNTQADQPNERLDKQLDDILQQLKKHRVVIPSEFIDLARVLMILTGIVVGYDIKMTDILAGAMRY